MRKTIEKTNSFTASADDGRSFVVQVFTEIMHIHSTGGISRLEGIKQLRTSQGYHINRVEKGVYSVLELDGLIIRSPDLNAA